MAAGNGLWPPCDAGEVVVEGGATVDGMDVRLGCAEARGRLYHGGHGEPQRTTEVLRIERMVSLSRTEIHTIQDL